MGIKIEAPVVLSSEHNMIHFDSDSSELNNWLKNKALKNEGRSSRTYVICRNNCVIGYYSLAAGAVSHEEVIGKLKRNMPDPIPVMILGRLAIDKSKQGQGLGTALLKDALLRTLQAANILGIRAILVHAINASAKKFYQNRGFRESPLNTLTLMLPLEEILYNLN